MNIQTNSKKIKKGDTFIALGNGHKYIEDAISSGATKVVVEKGRFDVETIIVPDTREYLINHLKNNYYKQIKDINIIGITGTNGKTTTAYLIYQALNIAGLKCAYIGTIGFYIEEKIRDLDNTTPDILEIYEMILEAKEKGCTHIVMEVSSHSLDIGRVDALKFDYVIFTNLTSEHLDYHKTMDNYFNAKKKIFKLLKDTGISIINNDDNYVNTINIENKITVGFSESDYKIGNFIFDSNTIFELNDKEYVMKLLGKYNIYNMSFTIALLKEMKISDISSIVSRLDPPVGRMQIITYGTNKIIVDYAHTKDAVLNIINGVKEFNKRNIITIVGCGGNRDKTKRPEIAKTATTLSDYVIITSDNPRFEDPMDIINDMTKGLTNTNYQVIVNRKEAIEKGIQLLNDNDILLILGKGHEKYQIINDEKIYFDDVETVITYMN